MKLTNRRALAPLALVVAAPLVVSVLASSPAAIADASAVCPTVPKSGVLEPEALMSVPDVIECDLVGVPVQAPDVDLTVDIPPVGGTISMFALTNDPTLSDDQTSLTIEVEPDGDLLLPASDPSRSESTSSAAAADPCLDTSYVLLDRGPMREAETFKINKSSIPNTLNTANAVSAIEQGMRNWPQVNNDCSQTDDVNATVQYGGDTSEGTSTDPVVSGCNFSSGAYDESSVVGFGTLPAGVYGRTCRYYPPLGTIVAGDIRLNNSLNWTTSPGSCTNAYDVESVVTHEAGHWWGLAHVGEVNRLTMTAGVDSTFPCTLWMRTLGLGDVFGIRDLY